jgi:hypothetical protein
MGIIYKKGKWRIREELDDCFSLNDLKGDIFKPECNPDLTAEQLQTEEKDFEQRVNDEGVWCYFLECWNSEVDHGWEIVDAIGGFVGQYNGATTGLDHYIVEEWAKAIEDNDLPE